MTETGLLVAQGAILLVLFGFLVAIVRSAGAQLGRTTPPPRSLPIADTAPEPVAAIVDAPDPVFMDDPALEPLDPIDIEPEPIFDIPTTTPVVAADAPIAAPLADDPFAPSGDVGDELPLQSPTGGSTGRSRPAIQDDGAGFLAIGEGLQPRLVVEKGPGLTEGAEFPIGQGLTIGRSRSNELHLEDSFVSHMHARILRRGAFYYVEDLGSTNGTFLNDKPVEDGTPVRVRDTLRLGETVLRYEE
ncbi:MAG: FHA domain-containing protein [Thermoleophilia bacterium]